MLYVYSVSDSTTYKLSQHSDFSCAVKRNWRSRYSRQHECDVTASLMWDAATRWYFSPLSPLRVFTRRVARAFGKVNEWLSSRTIVYSCAAHKWIIMHIRWRSSGERVSSSTIITLAFRSPWRPEGPPKDVLDVSRVPSRQFALRSCSTSFLYASNYLVRNNSVFFSSLHFYIISMNTLKTLRGFFNIYFITI